MRFPSASALSALSAVAFLASIAGCAADTRETSPDGEETPVDEPLDGVDDAAQAEDALTTVSNTGFYIVTRQDTRKCMSPFCGGVFVKRVNDAKTRCADGSMQDECYVSAITVNGVGFSEREKVAALEKITKGEAVIRARQYKASANGTTLGTLKASEVWLGRAGGTPDGTFLRAADNGVRCVTTPCPSITAFQLNGKDSHVVTRVLFGNAAAQDAKDAAQRALGTKEGVLVAGGILLPKCPPRTAGCGPLVSATELYLRAVPREGKACGSRNLGGCGLDQFCSHPAVHQCGAADQPGTCSYRPAFCPAVYAPVCGCDGKTYGNSCEASSGGTSVAVSGPCAP